MKTIAAIIIGLTFMLTSQTFAEDGDAKKPENGESGKKGEGKKGERRKKMMEKFDTNGDGKLDEAEKEALKKAMAERKAKGKKEKPEESEKN